MNIRGGKWTVVIKDLGSLDMEENVVVELFGQVIKEMVLQNET